jgi:hypothetical protein
MNIFDKLNLKNQSEIVVVNAPQNFEKELESLTIQHLGFVTSALSRPSNATRIMLFPKKAKTSNVTWEKNWVMDFTRV